MSFSENLLSLEEAMDLNFKKKTVFMGFTFWFIFPLMQDEDETDVKKKGGNLLTWKKDHSHLSG